MKNIKKIAAALAVVIGFGLYSWHTKSEAAESKQVALNSTTTASNTTKAATSTATANSSSTASATISTYKDGTYTGSIADAYYGYIQVRATISGGKLTNVEFLQYPNDHHESVEINQRAMPILAQEAIQSQTAQVDGVSGATDTSIAFVESMNAALNQAQ